jgi:hypothetical protein
MLELTNMSLWVSLIIFILLYILNAHMHIYNFIMELILLNTSII